MADIFRVSRTEFEQQWRQVCQLAYHVACDAGWRTLSAKIDGWLGERALRILVEVDSGPRWRLNDVEQPGVAGCIDVDLNFSPSTNLIPIRRLKIAAGESAGVTAAWLHFHLYPWQSRLPAAVC